MRTPEFDNLLKVLKCEKPSRPTLFEFFLNKPLYDELAGEEIVNMDDPLKERRIVLHAFKNAGYDYATAHPPDKMAFESNEIAHEQTISQNEYSTIYDRQSFEEYAWPEPETLDYSIYDELGKELPDGMKLIVCGPGGVLENVIRLVGFDRLCFMTIDDEQLTNDIFDAIGSRLVKHYELAAQYDTVGALISNDDWGFKTQIMLSPEMFRRYLIPWHRRIAEACHAAGKPVILHSCGNLETVMEDIIKDIKYDGKHSYEDNIMPVEDAYDKYHSRIGIMGGIDLDFVCRKTPEEVYERSRKMLERSEVAGAFALGSGNSIPEYVPKENYYAMISAAVGDRRNIH